MENEIDYTEQWKLGGNCDNCRRQFYCKKQCTAKKEQDKAQLKACYDAIYNAMFPNIPRRY